MMMMMMMMMMMSNPDCYLNVCSIWRRSTLFRAPTRRTSRRLSG
jgi:hypothetical protein